MKSPALQPMEVDDESDRRSSLQFSDSAASTVAVEAEVYPYPNFVNTAVSLNYLQALFGPCMTWIKSARQRIPRLFLVAVQALIVWQLHLFELLLSALLIDTCALLYCRGALLSESHKRFRESKDKNCDCEGCYKVDIYTTILMPLVMLRAGIFPGSPKYHEFRIWLSRHPSDQHCSSNDEIWRKDEPNNNCLIVGMALIAGKVKLEEVRRAVLTRWLHREYKLRSVIERRNGRSVWSICNIDEENANFSSPCVDPAKPFIALSDLIREVELPLGRSDDTKTTPAEAAVHQFLSELASRPMREGKPLWEMYLVNNVNDNSYIVVRCHHSIMDGAACAHALANVLFDPACTPPYAFSTELSKRRASVFYLVQAIRTIAVGIPPLLKWLLWYPASPSLVQAPLTPTHRVVELPLRPPLTGEKYLVPCVTIPLESVRLTAQAVSSASGQHFSIHDILTICCVQAADDLRRGRAHEIAARVRRGENWCIEKSTLIKKGVRSPSEAGYSRPDDCLYTLLPMTCRTGLPTKMDNFTAPVLLSHPFHQFGNSGESFWSWDHLLAIREVNTRMKQNRTNMIFFIYMRIFSKLLPGWMTGALVRRALTSPVSSVSNVAGPLHKARFCGQTVESIHFWAPTAGRISVGLAFLSYGGCLQITTSFDKSEVAELLRDEGERNFALESDILRGIFAEVIAEKLLQLLDFSQQQRSGGDSKN